MAAAFGAAIPFLRKAADRGLTVQGVAWVYQAFGSDLTRLPLAVSLRAETDRS
jgi:hypothetical protein